MVSKGSSTKPVPGAIRWAYGLGLLVVGAGLAVVLLLSPTKLLQLAGLGAKAEKIEALFLTASRWRLLQVAVGGLAVVWLGIGLLLRPLTAGLSALGTVLRRAALEARGALGRLRRQVRQAPLWLRLALLGLFGVVFASELYEARYFPLAYDEIWTYLNFSVRGPLVALAYYPAPNNHVLYSLASSVTVALTSSPALGLRLPAVLAAAGTFWLLLALLLRHSALPWAVWGLFLFYSCYIIFSYSFMGRGYSFQVLAFVGSLGAVLELLAPRSRYRTAAWVGFSGFSFVGLATVPTYVYPLATEFLLLGVAALAARSGASARFLKLTLLAGLLVGGATVAFYLPILVLSGPAALFGNKYVVPISRSEVVRQLPGHVRDTLGWFFSAPVLQYLLLGLAAAALVAAASKTTWPHRRAMLQLGWFFLLPGAFMLAQAVVPFPRTWIYLVVVLVLLACWLLAQLFRPGGPWQAGAKGVLPLALVGSIGVWGAVTYQNSQLFQRGYASYFAYDQAYAHIAKNAGEEPIVVDTDNADVMMEFQHRTHGRPYRPLRQYASEPLPAALLLVHDKGNKLETVRPGPEGQRRTLYEDTFVAVSEITSPTYHP